MAQLDDEAGSGLLDEAGAALADESGGSIGPSSPYILDGAGAPILDGTGSPILDGTGAGGGTGGGGGGGADSGVLLDEAGFGLEDEAGASLLAESGTSGGGGGGGTSGTFPDIPLDARAELQLAGAWTDVTEWMDHGPVSIGRGHPDESTTVSPSTMSLTLTNGDARFSPDNVMSPYWPYLAQNTPVRVSVPAQQPCLRLENDSQDRAYVNDNANLHIAGSIEMRIELRVTDWQGGILAQKADGLQSWLWVLGGDGTMTWGYWDSGGTYRSVSSDVPLPFTSGTAALRVTFDATVGTLAFWTSDSIDGSWSQLGDAWAMTGATATSIRTGSAPLVVGYSFNGYAPLQQQLHGQVYGFRLYNGIGGTVAADAAFTGQAPGVTAWADSAGNAWQLAGGAELSGRSFLGHFEASEWPQDEPAYNPDDEDAEPDALVPVAGGGLLRRYTQRNAAVSSALKRAILLQSGNLAPVAYWPMEDSAGAALFGSATGGPAMTINGTPGLAADSSFIASNPLPTLDGAVLCGQVPAYAGSGAIVVRFPVKLGTLPGSSYATLLRLSTSGTVRALYVVAYATGGLGLIGYDADGNTIVSTGDVAFAAGGKALWYSAEILPVSGGVQCNLVTVAPGATVGSETSVTVSGASVGLATEVTGNPNGFFTDTVMGHVSVQSAWSSLFDLGGALNAWQAEPAGTRFARLCREEGIPCRTRGNLADTTLMGAQAPQTLQQLLQQCADADQGVWTETRECLGWGYVTRKALYNQPATVAVSYASDHLSMWSSSPTRDDQFIVNDVTYSNSGGSSARVYAAPGQPIPGGRMSALAPRYGGAGTYDQSYGVAIQDDSGLPNLAGWRLHLGTVDQARLPGIQLDLTGRDLASQFYAVLGMDLADRLVIASPPPRLGPDTVTQLVQQLNLEIWHDTLTVGITGVPELPYQVARAGLAHAQTGGTTLAAAATATATTLQFATAPGRAPWTTRPSDFPFDVRIGGEVMTVTGISGTSSPQAAAVIRSVNGVAKAQPAGAQVAVWTPVTAGL